MRTAAEESGQQDYKFSSTGYEPNDSFLLTESYVEFNQESVTEQRFTEDLDYDDAVIGQTLFKECRRRVDHSEGEGLSSGLSSSPMSLDRTRQPVVDRDKSHEPGYEIQRQNSENEQIRTLDRQKEQILAGCQAEIRKHEFQADYDRRSIQKLNETIESHKEEICRAHQGDERRRQDHQLLHEQLLKQIWDLREAHEEGLNEMEELNRFQGSTSDTFARRRLVEDQVTIVELTGKIQELQNEINCVNDSSDFQDAESVRSGLSHVTSRPVSFPPHPVPSIGMPSRKDGPPSFWDTHGISGNVFAGPVASSTAPNPQELNPWSSGISEPIHSSTAEKNENQTPVQDQRCQSGPSAKNSSLVKETLQRIMVQTNNDCRFQIFMSINSPHTINDCLLEDKIQYWGMYLFTISYGSYALFQWSGDGWISGWKKSSSFVRGIRIPDFEVFDARIASALHRIINNTQF